LTGGFSLGLERAGMETVAFCEVDQFCRKVLNKHWPGIPIFDDIKQLTKQQLIDEGVIENEESTNNRTIDIVVGGPPCQPASCAGKRRGTEDDRWLWGEALRIVALLKPKYCLFENPTGILSLQGGVPFESVLSELENQGYETAAFIIPACSVNAPHRRDRVWILANAKGSNDRRRSGEIQGKNEQQTTKRQEEWVSKFSSSGEVLAYSERIGRGRRDHENAPGQGGALQTPGSCAGNKQGILADTAIARSRELSIQSRGSYETSSNINRNGENVSDTESEQNRRLQQRQFQPDTGTSCQDAADNGRVVKSCLGGVAHGLSSGLAGHWDREPNITRIAVGVLDRVNKLKALGNSIVPQLAEILGRAILEAERRLPL